MQGNNLSSPRALHVILLKGVAWMMISQFLILTICWSITIQSITRARDSNQVKCFKCSKDKDGEMNEN